MRTELVEQARLSDERRGGLTTRIPPVSLERSSVAYMQSLLHIDLVSTFFRAVTSFCPHLIVIYFALVRSLKVNSIPESEES